MEHAYFTRRLPIELMLLVIGHLDHYSLMALLEALPWLKSETVLITDHHFPPMFTTVQGVKRRYLSSKCPHHHGLPLYDKAMDSEPIKILEFAYTDESLSRFVDEVTPGITSSRSSVYQKLTKVKHSVNLNSTSFVFADISRHLTFSEVIPDTVERSERDGNGSKWLLGCRTLPSEGCRLVDSHVCGPMKGEECPEILMASPCTKNVVSPAANIVLLYIDNTTMFKDHTFPLLESLTVAFPDSSCVLSSITVPKLTHLVIHYNRTLPVINGICIEGEDAVNDEWCTIFELCDTSSYFPQYRSPNPLLVQDTVSQCDFKFMQKFRTLTLTGVPFEVFEVMDFARVDRLFYHMSVVDTRRYKKPISEMPKLEFIWINIVVDNLELPLLIAPHIKFSKITILSKDVDISGFLLGSSGTANLVVFRARSLASAHGSNDVMSPANWRRFFEQSQTVLGVLTLYGFSMPFLHLNDGETPVYFSRLQHVILMPILNSATVDLSSDVMMIDGFWYGDRLSVTTFAPVAIGQDALLWRSRTNLVLSFDDTFEDPILGITCGLGFKSYALYDCPNLPMVESRLTRIEQTAEEQLYFQTVLHSWLTFGVKYYEPDDIYAPEIAPGMAIHYDPEVYFIRNLD